MKFKRLLTTLVLATMPLASFSATAYASTNARTITVPIELDSSISDNIKGCFAEITYDPAVLEPILKGQDLNGNDNYVDFSNKHLFTSLNTGNTIKLACIDNNVITDDVAKLEFTVLNNTDTTVTTVIKDLLTDSGVTTANISYTQEITLSTDNADNDSSTNSAVNVVDNTSVENAVDTTDNSDVNTSEAIDNTDNNSSTDSALNAVDNTGIVN